MAKTKPSKQQKPQDYTGTQHPEKYRDDLNPNAQAGQNTGRPASYEAGEMRKAEDVKSLHRRLADQFRDDELRQIPVLPEGARLKQNATYIDLSHAQPREFTAEGNMTAGADNHYVPKSDVPYELWNRLIGVKEPERL